jgi:hypothetical protein
MAVPGQQPQKSYQQWAQAIQPTWMQTPLAAAWVGQVGAIKDWLIQNCKLGVLQRFPYFAAPDALAQIGIDRGILQSPTDTLTSYAQRLVNAWTAWQYAGTAFGLLTQLAAAGYTNVLIAQQNQWLFTLSGGALVAQKIDAFNNGTAASPVYFDRPYWLFDLGQAGALVPAGGSGTPNAPADLIGWPQARRWARYQVIFLNPLPSGPSPLPNWTNVQPTLTSSTSPALSEIDSIRKLIAQWGPGISICKGITAVTHGQVWGYPQLTWTNSDTWATLWASTSVTWTQVVGSPT